MTGFAMALGPWQCALATDFERLAYKRHGRAYVHDIHISLHVLPAAAGCTCDTVYWRQKDFAQRRTTTSWITHTLQIGKLLPAEHAVVDIPCLCCLGMQTCHAACACTGAPLFPDKAVLLRRRTTIRQYLDRYPEILDERPPPELEGRYSG